MSNSSPVASNELVHFAAQFVGDEYRRTGRAITGPKLASAIRTRYPDFSYEQVGLNRLGDVVRLAEEEGLLQRRKEVVHLELLPGLASPVQRELPTLQSDDDLRFVRPNIWRAMVFFREGTVSVYDRATAQVLEFNALAHADQIKTYEQDERYVKIEAIKAHVQQDWMRAFLESVGAANASDAPITSDHWWIEFPAWLQHQVPDLTAKWRSYRVRSVIAYVRSWAAQNKVPISAVLTCHDPKWRTTDSAAPDDTLSRQSHPNLAQRRTESESENEILRRIILAAISELSTDDLCNLSIPIKHILRHVRPK